MPLSRAVVRILKIMLLCAAVIHHFTDNMQPKDQFWVRVRPIITEYLEVTTIHGLRYLMECKSIIEKLFWLAIICFSFGYSAHIIQTFFVDNDREPILTTIGTSRIQDVPFPAITIRHSLHQILVELILIS